MKFDTTILSPQDYLLADALIGIDRGGIHKDPDLVIAPDGMPYLYRWWLLPKNEKAGCYFHVQVASDPERPLHDHPWDNTSVILSGGYDEQWDPHPWWGLNPHITRPLRAGDVCFRRAGEAHRLILPLGMPYTMTLFSTGPRVRKWGFWFEEGWRSFESVTQVVDGQSKFTAEALDVLHSDD